jgi:O-antigen/teichoic acid export membrane protein
MEGAKNRVIGRNILANVFGGSWSLFLSLLIVPLKMRILGVDAFGLLAFIASLQVILGIFDLGLSPTIAREVAIDTSPNLRHAVTYSRRFRRSTEVLVCCWARHSSWGQTG